MNLAEDLTGDFKVTRFRQELLPAVALLDDRLLDVDGDVDHFFNIEEAGKQGSHLGCLILSEKICDYEALTSQHFVIVNVRCLVLFVRLAKQLTHLVEEAFVVSKLTPRLNAEDEVEPSLSPEQLRNIDLSCWHTGLTNPHREVSFDAVEADNSSRLEIPSQKLEAVGLAVTDIENAQSLQ